MINARILLVHAVKHVVEPDDKIVVQAASEPGDDFGFFLVGHLFEHPVGIYGEDVAQRESAVFRQILLDRFCGRIDDPVFTDAAGLVDVFFNLFVVFMSSSLGLTSPLGWL